MLTNKAPRHDLRARLAQLSFTCRVVFRKQLHEQLHERGREPCFGSFTMCLTLWEWVFREAGQRVGQRVGCLAIEVVKLLVKLLMKLYQTGPKTNFQKIYRSGHDLWYHEMSICEDIQVTTWYTGQTNFQNSEYANINSLKDGSAIGSNPWRNPNYDTQ
jgi:hypothetical protein